MLLKKIIFSPVNLKRCISAGPKIEYTLKELITEMKNNLNDSQIASEKRLANAQVALKQELAITQAASEKRLADAQVSLKKELADAQIVFKTDVKEIVNVSFYKVVFTLTSIFIACLSIFDSMGVYIQYPWRKPGHPKYSE